jgi:hypothetical protein
MISRRQAIGGMVAGVIGSRAARASAAQQPQQQVQSVRQVAMTFRGGFGFLIKAKTSLLAMTPKRPEFACGDWADHPLYIIGSSDEATVEADQRILGKSNVPTIWAVRLEGRCVIKTGGPSSPLIGPQLSEDKTRGLESPYTPVPYASENGWNDAAWLLPLGKPPGDLDARVKDSLTVNGGQLDVLTPPNSGAMRGRWELPKWDKGKKHKRALTDRIRLSYTATFASLVIQTGVGDVTITPKTNNLSFGIQREIDLPNVVITDGLELKHARMIYALSSSSRCEDLKWPKFEIIKSRQDSLAPTPGDFCPFGMFDIE